MTVGGNPVVKRIAMMLMLCLTLPALPVSGAQRIFDLLNLELPALARVRTAVDRGDWESAGRELLLYFQSRKSRTFSHFILRYDSIEADQTCRNSFLLRAQRVNFGKTIDWRRTGIDKEWNFALNRMEWLVNYAGMYVSRRDENLARTFIEQVQSWIRGTSDPGFPRSIDTGNRLYHWCVAHWVFVQKLRSPSVTPEFNTEMLGSMAAQAEFLYAPEHWRRFSNWGTLENNGLALFAIMFPEFRRSEDWLNEVRFRMYFQLTHSYHQDGMHTEVSPSYHTRELEVWLRLLLAAEENSIALSLPAAKTVSSPGALLTPPAEALMYLLRPDGTTPNVGDSDAEDETGILSDLASYLHREDMLYVATRGKEGAKPAGTSAAFPQGGYYVMRNGWGSVRRPMGKEMYLLFDSGTNMPWHAHYDQLNVVADANGTSLLRDAGRYTYNEDRDRAYFKGTASHNTVVIDGLDQPRAYSPAPGRWITGEGFDYASGVNSSNTSASHRRSVFFVKPDYWLVTDFLAGSGEHRYDQYWHLSEFTTGRVTFDARTNQVTTPGMVLVSPTAESAYSLEESWVSPRYRQRVKAPALKRTEFSRGAFTWSTLIYPYEGRPPVISMEQVPVVSGDRSLRRAAVRIVRDDTVDLYFERDSLMGMCTFDSFSTDASLLFVRRTQGGAVVAFFFAGGSSVMINRDTLVAFRQFVKSAALVGGRMAVDSPCSLSFVVQRSAVTEVLMSQRHVQLAPAGRMWRYDAGGCW